MSISEPIIKRHSPNPDLSDKYENSDWTDSSQTKSSEDLKHQIKQQQTNIGPVSEQQKTAINNQNNRQISFSASSREHVVSPSPISSTRSTPEPPKAQEKVNSNKEAKPYINSLKSDSNNFVNG